MKQDSAAPCIAGRNAGAGPAPWRQPSGVSLPASAFRRLASVFRPPPSDRRRAAFSLVEVSLALVVVAVGIFGIMSLFPAGLDQNARSIAETHAAFFAEEVFAGLRGWTEVKWAGLEDLQASAELSAACYDKWYQPNDLKTKIDNAVSLNSYRRAPPPVNASEYVDHALRYRMNITTNGLVKQVALQVYAGEFGGTNDPALFYAEFFRFAP